MPQFDHKFFSQSLSNFAKRRDTRIAGLILQPGNDRLLRVNGGRQFLLGDTSTLAGLFEESSYEKFLITGIVAFGKERVAILALLNVFIEVVLGLKCSEPFGLAQPRQKQFWGTPLPWLMRP